MANWEVGIEDFFASPPPPCVWENRYKSCKEETDRGWEHVTNDVRAEDLAFNEQTTNFQQMHWRNTDSVSLFTRSRSWLQVSSVLMLMRSQYFLRNLFLCVATRKER